MNLNKLRHRVENIPGIADRMARQALKLPWKFAIAYDFNLPEEVEEYGELIERCRDAFGANVRWRAEASRGRAIFELATDRDAAEFVLMCDRPTEVLPRTVLPRR
ncbi:hypothetical protein ACN2C6_13595 [Caulobacter sp. ErkDOM-YI]|uniref:hypothetical protein n=1 Tax=unclassified Caulobacter TaxID=2648921 RepID=UPI003AF73C0B